jgi:membrane protease YdiL (CAAX protease family)
MQPELSIPGKQEALIRRYPVVTYFALTFLISWSGALAVVAPYLIRRQPLPKGTGLLMFPVMLVGPSLAGLMLTQIVDGKRGLGSLFSAVVRARVPLRWYAMLLIPPILILTVLIFLQRFVSPVYAPNRFFMGVAFGIPAGFLEEIGWTGYALPKMLSANDGPASSVLLGLLWAVWHLPVINYLGTSSPHGAYWLQFFLAFSLAMTAMRVLIAWIYTNTKSVLLAQLMHVSSTGSLVVFSAASVTAAQEAMWYALYGTALWVAVGIILMTFGGQLRVARNQGAQSD